MGAETFVTTSLEPDPNRAFHELVEEAAYEYGHGGYTGTIAEKSEYVIIQRQVISQRGAEALADQLIQDADPRIDDKWGPAGAIPFGDSDDVDLTDAAAVEAWLATEPPIQGWVFFGWASS